VRHFVRQADMFQGARNGEQQHEEQQGPPVHLALDIEARPAVAPDHDAARARQGGDEQHAVRLQPQQVFQLVVGGNGQQGHRQQGNPLPVRNLDVRHKAEIPAQPIGEALVENVQFPAIPQQGHAQRDRQRQQHDGKSPENEIDESQPGLGSDVNAHGIAHHRAGAADIGAQDAGDEVRRGIQLQAFAHLEH